MMDAADEVEEKTREEDVVRELFFLAKAVVNTGGFSLEISRDGVKILGLNTCPRTAKVSHKRCALC